MKDNLKDITPYIPGKTIKGAVKLASNENPLGTSQIAKKAYSAAADELHLYPDGYCYELRARLSEEMNIPAERLIFGNGSDELLLLIAGAFVDKDDEVITSDSTFSEYTFSARVFAGIVKYAPMKDFRFDLEGIKKLVTDKTKLIYLCNPNNPTGTYFTDLEKFLTELPSDIIVVCDEAYYEYVTAEDFPQSLELLPKFKNLVVLRTFSKIYGLAALRIGYGIADPEIIEMIARVKEPFNVNMAAQKAAIAALEDQEFVKRSQDNNRKGKQFLYQQLDQLNVKYLPTQTNFVFIYELPFSAQDIFKKLIEKNLIIRPMDSFGYSNAIRVTIGTPEQNELFIKEFALLL